MVIGVGLTSMFSQLRNLVSLYEGICDDGLPDADQPNPLCVFVDPSSRADREDKIWAFPLRDAVDMARGRIVEGDPGYREDIVEFFGRAVVQGFSRDLAKLSKVVTLLP